ncbi:hypothetical protein PAMC26577_22075 [Caballeronia sordidicola]|uniref:Uncharacterized protein n=1 Tax=Caballeronia sordidicola TaxID=196367 RepID=A0A242ML81_CABSO|nr:hypothetical protein PAMC26577_22075 [Caballeronia sordidicola]
MLGVTALDVYAARGIREELSNDVTPPMRNHSNRTGFPSPAGRNAWRRLSGL